MLRYALAPAAALVLAGFPAAAETPEGWSGEGSFSAGVTTGNTETSDLGVGVLLDRKAGLWTLGTEFAADFAETDGLETKDRYFLALQGDREINERLYGFGRTSWEQDAFSGFDSRLFVGGGLGFRVYDTERLGWTLEGGPGLKVDEVEAVLGTDANGDPVILTPSMTEESFSTFARSTYRFDFNEAVGLSNDTNLLYGSESTQINNVLALTAALNSALSARFSFDVRHDTNPPLGFEDTDTATRVSLVYGFN